MAGFREALAVVLESEGGLSDDPNDPGGRTHYGISTPKWLEWRDRLGKSDQPVDACTLANAERIYWEDEWLGGKCSQLSWPLSLVHFDSMVQHGAATKLLQKAVGARPDGKLGPKTLARANEWDGFRAAEQLIWVRLEYYTELANWPHAGRGWTKRMIRLRQYVMATRSLPEVA